MSSWPKFIEGCKSRFSAIARSCYMSRELWRSKYRKLCDRYRAMRASMSETIAGLKRRENELEQLVAQLKNQLNVIQADSRAKEQYVLPENPAVKGQHFGAKTIELAVNLGREVGLRPAIRAMEIMFQSLDIPWELPVYQTLRTWMQRLGIARQQTVKKRKDWIWLDDLSIQVGRETFMAIVGIPKAKLPRPGQAICLDDLSPLALKPIAGGWDKEKVGTIYQQTIEKFGQPIAAVTDGADELRTPYKSLENEGNPIRLIRDVKHFLANLMKKTLSDTGFHEFSTTAYGTHSKIQQTELGHLAPPMCKQKARFMNLEPLLNWGRMILWQFQHPESDGRKGITNDRLEAKLGWIRDYRHALEQWGQLQDIVSATLKRTNRFGLHKQCASELHSELQPLAKSNISRKFLDQIIGFISCQEEQLKGLDRLPCSTEILESAFGKFKQLEKQHAHGGFTHLLAAFPTLLKPVSVSEVIRSFAIVKIKDIDHWVDANLPKTLTARIQSAYDEYHAGPRKKKLATHCAATC